LGEATHFLGIRIIRDRLIRKLWLIQDSYIDSFAQKYKVSNTSNPKTPLPAIALIPYDSQTTQQQIYGYQQRIGSLNFLGVFTRPDIARACSKLAEFLQNPSPQHIAAAKHLSEYIVGTRNLAPEFDGKIRDKRSS
jgi:hypothetical protein